MAFRESCFDKSLLIVLDVLVQRITDLEDLRAIESASASIKVEGARYPQWVEQTTGR